MIETARLRLRPFEPGDRDALVLETLMAFKRAGCSGVLSYHAPVAARLLAR